jgi:hypothetical protein
VGYLLPHPFLFFSKNQNMTELEKLLSTASDVTSFRDLVVKNYPNVIVRPANQLEGENYISSGIGMYNHFYYVNTCDIYMLFNDYNVIVNPRNNNIIAIHNDNDGCYGLDNTDAYVILSHEPVDFSNLQSLWSEFQKTIHAVKFKEFGLTKLKPILDEVHGENYDLQVCSDGNLDLLIRYPHITITNTQKKSREIEELYCVLSFDSYGLLKNFSGFRAKMSFNDVKNGYRHSHLNSRNLQFLFDVSAFCTGSTDLTALKSEFMEGFDADRFDLFLYQINNFVEWESLEGTPYVNLSTVSNKNFTVLSREPLDLAQTITNDFNKFCAAYKENPDLFKPLLNYNNLSSNIEVSIQNVTDLARALAPYSTYYGTLDSNGEVQTVNNEIYDYQEAQENLNHALSNITYKTFRNNPINYDATIMEQQAEITTEFCSKELLSFSRAKLQELLSTYHTSVQTEDVYLSRDNFENLVLMS